MRLLLFFFFYYLFLLWYGVNFLSFSIVEAQSYEKVWFLKYIYEIFFVFLGKNDLTLRIVPVFFSILSVIIFYLISKSYFKKQKDLEFNVIIFSLIPGFIISSLIVNKSIFLIFLTLLFVYTYKKNKLFSYLLLFSYAFIDYAFINLYFALIFYAIYKKDTKFLFFVLFLFAINANIFNYEIGGKPRGYFLDVLGTYFLIFSPFVFVYYVYTLYKGAFLQKDIIYYISALTFLLSILLSFRQHIRIDDYAPFALIYIIYMVRIFLNSYRVRLPQFRRGYKIIFSFLFGSLILFDAAIFLNRYTPAKNLSNSFYFIKPIVKILKNKKINYIACNNKYLCKSLYFYGINKGEEFYLKYSKRERKVSIFHKKRKIYEINVSNLNTL